MNELRRQVMKMAKSILRNPTVEMRNSFRSLPEAHQWMLFSLLDIEDYWFFGSTLDKLRVTFEQLTPPEAQRPFLQVFLDLQEAFLVKKRERVDWIHPTTKELTVHELREHGAHRVRFLTLCSAAGLKVALAIGFGSNGNEHFPLMMTCDDWIQVAERIPMLGRNNALILLSGIHAAVVKAELTQGQQSSLKELMRRSLELIIRAESSISQWTPQQVTSILILKIYCKSHIRLAGFAAFMRSELEDTYEWLSDESISTTEYTHTLKDWGSLLTAFKSASPSAFRRFVRTQGFLSLIEKLSERAADDRGIYPIFSANEREERRRWRDEYSQLADAVGSLLPALSERMDLVSAVQCAQSDFEAAASNVHDDEDEARQPEDEETYSPVSASTLDEIEQLFSDL
jgi:hypothetical protein